MAAAIAAARRGTSNVDRQRRRPERGTLTLIRENGNKCECPRSGGHLRRVWSRRSAFDLNSLSSGAHCGSTGTSRSFCSVARASSLRLIATSVSARKYSVAVLFGLYVSALRRCSSDFLLLPPNRPGTLLYQRPRARSAEPC